MIALQEAVNHKRCVEGELNAMLDSFTTITGLTVHEISVHRTDIRSIIDNGTSLEYSTRFDVRVDGYAS